MKTLPTRTALSSLFACLLLLDAHAQPVPLQQATADQTYTPYYYPSNTLDGITTGDAGWGLAAGGSPATIVYETQTNLGYVGGSILTFKLYQGTSSATYPYWHLGRFRLSVTTDNRNTFADGLANSGSIAANWTVLQPGTFLADNGATLTRLSDNSLLASGGNTNLDTIYTVAATTGLTGITGVRLEALNDPSLPNHGPGRSTAANGGNFVLQEFQVTVATGTLITTGIQVADVAVTWNSRTNKLYQVQSSSALSPNNWTNFVAPVQGNGSNNLVIDSVLGQPQKYYRVIELP